MKNLTNIQIDGEEWRDIPGFDGAYQASTLGRIRRTAHRVVRDDGVYDLSARICAQRMGFGRSAKAFLGTKLHNVDAIMAVTFIDPEFTGMGKWICHKDGDIMNCRPDNLEVRPKTEKCRRKRLAGFLSGMVVRSGDLVGKFVKCEDGIVHLETPAPAEVSPEGLRRLTPAEFEEWNASLMNRPMGHRMYYSKTRKKFAYFFEPFDKIITRNSDDESWVADFYSHYIEDLAPGEAMLMCMRGPMRQAMPYNEITASYIGTTKAFRGPCDVVQTKDD